MSAAPAPKDGLWANLEDSDLKAGIDAYFREKKAAKGRYVALIVDVENPISGYRIQRITTSKIHN